MRSSSSLGEPQKPGGVGWTWIASAPIALARSNDRCSPPDESTWAPITGTQRDYVLKRPVLEGLASSRPGRPGAYGAEASVASCARSVTHLHDALPRVLVVSLAPAADAANTMRISGTEHPVIRVEGLRKSFGDVHAVRGVDLRVERGQVLVLLGQNGAGKSTTLRCLGGILRPDAGLIELDGLRLPEKLDEVRGRLGVVPDQARLYGRNTAPEYLDRFGYLYGVPEAQRRRRITELLERFELADRTDTILAAYSRGMAQKVALIRATLHEPDWIFCDEPTAGLDPVAAADMRRYLGEQRARGAALIVTTHVLSEAELMADRIAIMRRGVIVTHGTLDGLRREAEAGRRFSVRLSRMPADPEPLRAWLREQTVAFELKDDRITYSLDWETSIADRADFAAELQKRLATAGAPYYELEEQQVTLESVYLKAMEEPLPPSAEVAPAPGRVASGIGALRMFGSLRSQWGLLRHSLPFYVSSWWRRGDLSWVMYLHAFVLLLVAGTSLFGQLPGVL